MMTKEQIILYLKRLDVREIHEPTKEYLVELHKAHVERIPWQSIDAFGRKRTSIDYEDSIQLILSGRSGYCFHLNGAFSMLLRSLGYRVKLHRSGVQSHGAAPRIDSFHLGLSVSLPGDPQSPSFLADVGIGDMPYEPIPLLEGSYKQGPFTYKLVPSEAAPNGWRLENDPRGAISAVDYDSAEMPGMDVFKPNHERLSLASDANWSNTFLIQNRHASGSTELRGCMFTQRNHEGIIKVEVTRKSHWFEILADVFGEQLCAYSSQEKDELWDKALRNHEAWKSKTS